LSNSPLSEKDSSGTVMDGPARAAVIGARAISTSDITNFFMIFPFYCFFAIVRYFRM
jgi:hypothetical protein